MVIPTGTASFQDIQDEFGGSHPISMTEYYGVTGGIPASGSISLNAFRGKASYTWMTATGGTVTTDGNYKYHTFTSSGTFTITNGDAQTVEYLVVGGGGGGGDRHGGGGGAGGYLAGNIALAAPATWTVIVGGGGAGGSYEAYNTSPRGSGGAGGNSFLTPAGTAYGGGGATRSANQSTVGARGGSGVVIIRYQFQE
ncbi:hypothetical protein vBLenPICBM1__50 [Lentibacter phage vB_LenP_ICBM1]|uniref:Glycine-rich domain-containing protein n=1 Tax=Lentibacter phage vB_LenP_ICBM1 TaxID=2847822 RepID=A0A3G2YRZ2_9CAUD|nr:hypothetical protein HWB27_gp50 [Lentibacter phage vB_LenP_ICBM1]AYP28163.1 hypothetical protein vBLenPICBM1__50 [Lentibacter phage vB_LenP_ICBM1]